MVDAAPPGSGLPVDDFPERVAALVASGRVPSLRAAIVHDGALREYGAGAGAEARFALASLSKPIVATACLIACEEGVLDLDREIRAWIPETPANASVADLLAHTSGLPIDDPVARRVSLDSESTWSDVAAIYARTEPAVAPGTRRIYSNAGYALAALALERASGMAWNSYVEAAILEPLGMTATRFGVATGDSEPLEVREPGLLGHGEQLFNGTRFRALGLPQSGAFGTAADYARLMAVYLAGGEPLLHPDTVARAVTNYGGPLEGGVEGFMTWPVCDWGLGFELRDGKRPHWTGDATSPATFSHFGASGTLAFADPQAGMAAVLLANRGTYSRWMLEPDGWPDLCAAILADR